MSEETLSKRARGGRPIKKIKRERHIRVRLTVAEHFRIEQKAKVAGSCISEWFRSAALKGKVMARLSKEEMGYLRMLSGMANNLNQLAKLANGQGLLLVQRKCRELIEEISVLMKKLDNDR